MVKVEHIGIAVNSLSDSIPLYEKLLNAECYKKEMVESEKVNTAFFRQGETKIELLESSKPDGVIARFIDKKGPGIHHIAFEVEDIYAEVGEGVLGRQNIVEIALKQKESSGLGSVINRFSKPLKRKPLNKAKSSRRFNKTSRRTKAANAPMRGGYRF